MLWGGARLPKGTADPGTRGASTGESASGQAIYREISANEYRDLLSVFAALAASMPGPLVPYNLPIRLAFTRDKRQEKTDAALLPRQTCWVWRSGTMGETMSLKLALAAFAVALAPATAMAQAMQDFSIVNETGYAISEVYVSSARADDWEEDVLGADVLPDEVTMNIQFRSAPKVCEFDLKVVYSDGENAIWSGFDLCSISTVTLYYDRKSGNTWADTE